MIDFFTNLYSLKFNDNLGLPKSFRVNSLSRFLVRHVANHLVPMYFFFYKRNEIGVDPEAELIVTLTSFPARISKVWLVVESIFRQSVKPKKVILWLSADQFPDLNSLPKRLLEQCNRGLEVYICEGDLRSHKKYFYTLERYPNLPFVIIDDDVIYPSNLLENLLCYHKKNLDTVCFNRGYRVSFAGGRFAPYESWQFLVQETLPRTDIMPTGMGAVLYPPGIFHPDVLKKEIFLEFCRYADDIWLYAMVRYARKPLLKTNENRLFVPINNKGAPTLTSINVLGRGNDAQLIDLHEFYTNTVGTDLFQLDGKTISAQNEVLQNKVSRGFS